MSLQEYIDPYEKRADCQEDYVSPPFNLPAVEVSGTSTDAASTSSGLEATVI